MKVETVNIVICDDEKLHREKLIVIIQEYCKRHGKLAVISEYSSGEECLSALREVDILFLDIDMEGIDGIEVKDRLERTHENVYIVFTTNYGNRMNEAFGMQVVSFIQKPVTLETVASAMDKVSKWISKRDFIELEGIGGKKNVFSIEQICYIEASNQYSKVALRSEEILVRKSLKAWETELSPKGFCRIHQSIIVNFFHVKEVGQKVIMEDNTVFPISIRRRKAVNQAYSQYIKNMLL
ncbi:MAG: response regulator transcription factor [Lachnospiraceae bacterium]|nr:response regulator transcription factor [Lachnospiraceae bacterium]